MTALARRAITRPAIAARRYTTIIRRTERGFYWWVTVDPHGLGLVVRSGWVAGSKRDAQAEAALAIRELRS